MLTQTAIPAVRTGSFKRPAMQVPPPAADHALGGTIDLMGAPMSFPRNAEIYGESDPADFLYKVVSGTVRTYKLLTDGRRQVGGFYVAGDIFGLETGEEHTFSAEAITECNVLVIKRSALLTLAGRDHDVARQLWTITGGELRRVQDHIGCCSSRARRSASPLSCWKCQSGSPPATPSRRRCPGQDIADYLGLTIQTVSRTLTILENAATIELSSSRRIVLRNRSAHPAECLKPVAIAHRKT